MSSAAAKLQANKKAKQEAGKERLNNPAPVAPSQTSVALEEAINALTQKEEELLEENSDSIEPDWDELAIPDDIRSNPHVKVLVACLEKQYMKKKSMIIENERLRILWKVEHKLLLEARSKLGDIPEPQPARKVCGCEKNGRCTASGCGCKKKGIGCTKTCGCGLDCTNIFNLFDQDLTEDELAEKLLSYTKTQRLNFVEESKQRENQAKKNQKVKKIEKMEADEAFEEEKNEIINERIAASIQASMNKVANDRDEMKNEIQRLSDTMIAEIEKVKRTSADKAKAQSVARETMERSLKAPVKAKAVKQDVPATAFSKLTTKDVEPEEDDEDNAFEEDQEDVEEEEEEEEEAPKPKSVPIIKTATAKPAVKPTTKPIPKLVSPAKK